MIGPFFRSKLTRTAAALAAALPAVTCPCPVQAARLTGFAKLPAATFAEGPTSGSQLGSSNINGQPLPFVDQQPVQGFSGIVNLGDGTFLVLLDNGFGSLENSADSLLRVYRIRPDFKTAAGGSGKIEVVDWITLHDPDRKLPFTLTQTFSEQRLLTGADLDPESMQRAPDGTLWFGDEFGPFLIHTDANGKVLEAPIPIPDLDNPGRELRSTQNPFYEEASALRVMNAVRHHARINGAKRPPVFSPWSALLQGNSHAGAVLHRGAKLDGPTAPTAALFSIKSLQSGGYTVVPWTVNDPAEMTALLKLGVDGLISDRPDLLYQAVSEFNANGDGHPGDLLLPDGRINRNRFDAQGHRGARDLRPENTLPALEAALDHLMTTLEIDCGLSRDGVAVLCHDPDITAPKARRSGEATSPGLNVLIREQTASELQTSFVADGIVRGAEQLNKPELSPVSLAFHQDARGVDDDPARIYAIPTLAEVFSFVDFYAAYYSAHGPGASHPQAAARSRNAADVRFNVETKLNPRTDTDALGRNYQKRTADPQAFVDAIAGDVVTRRLEPRVDIQSFDFRTLLLVQAQHPSIRTVYLFGDFPREGDGGAAGDGDGANLQPQENGKSPWLAGMHWPYRQTLADYPARVAPSGGLEGMALTPDGEMLLPLLEKPLSGSAPGTLFIHPFRLRSKSFTGDRISLQLDPRGKAIGDFAMYSPTRGMVIERDSSQGRLDGFKAVFEVEIDFEAGRALKLRQIDLQKLADPHGLSGEPTPGVIGVGPEFSMPFATIENIVIFDQHRFGVINDNNYPFGRGRHQDGRPDDTEFVLIEITPEAAGEGSQ